MTPKEEEFVRLPFRKKIKKQLIGQRGIFEWRLILLVLILFAMGFATVCSVESVREGTLEIAKQLLFGIIGIVLMIVIGRMDYKVFNSYLAFLLFFAFMAVNMGLSALAMMTGSINRGSGSFQPSEVLKFALIVVMSYMVCGFSNVFKNGFRKNASDGQAVTAKVMSKQFAFEKWFFRKFHSSATSTWACLVFVFAAVAAVLLQKHLSGAIIMLLIGFIVLLFGGGNKKVLIILAVLGIAAICAVIMFPEILNNIPGIEQYQYERIALWRYKYTVAEAKALGFSADRTQSEASLKAIGSGGWFGLGFQKSIQKYIYLSEAKTDFILAVVVEETGYIGTLVVLLCFAFLIHRCFKIAMTTRDRFGSLLVCGIASQIAMELILNIAVVTDSIPNTGITLPFFSYGGTALIMLFIEMGIVLSVSKNSYSTIEHAEKLGSLLDRSLKNGQTGGE